MSENLIIGLLFIILSIGMLFMILIMVGGVVFFLPETGITNFIHVFPHIHSL
ncbi:MAG TPA: hypothetical protein VNM45_04890 [Bacillus sp. (in: firmicutes)]|nr:hypothetical protein [Bacillus sp. (in: firmicutes)]